MLWALQDPLTAELINAGVIKKIELDDEVSV